MTALSSRASGQRRKQGWPILFLSPAIYAAGAVSDGAKRANITNFDSERSGEVVGFVETRTLSMKTIRGNRQKVCGSASPRMFARLSIMPRSMKPEQVRRGPFRRVGVHNEKAPKRIRRGAASVRSMQPMRVACVICATVKGRFHALDISGELDAPIATRIRIARRTPTLLLLFAIRVVPFVSH